MKPLHTLGAFAIVPDRDERVLLCHRTDMDFWNLPGGTVENGETPWNAAAREVLEETGLEVQVVRLLGVYAKPQKDEVVFSFLCRETGGRLSLNDEADRLEYFHTDELPENLLEKQRERILDWAKFSEEVCLKEQSGS